jgi:LSD1 subclass zinc finger protein
MISQDLLELLVCPACKKPVVLNPDGKSLKCGVCRRVYAIQDDIPIMLLDLATIDPA